MKFQAEEEKKEESIMGNLNSLISGFWKTTPTKKMVTSRPASASSRRSSAQSMAQQTNSKRDCKCPKNAELPMFCNNALSWYEKTRPPGKTFKKDTLR